MIEIDADAEALELIARLRSFVTDTFMGGLEVELRLALAFRLMRQGGADEGFVRALSDALEFAQQKGYIFGFRCLFRAHRLLFDAAFRLGIHDSFLRDIVVRFNIRPGGEAGESWPWPVKIHTLGRFQVLVQDRPLAFGRKTPRKVLAFLKCIVAHGSTHVPDHKIIDALWPDEDGAAARHAFRIALHRVREALGSSEAILHADGQVSFNRDIVWDDASAFEASVRPGAGGDSEQCLRLYRGEFLPQEVDSPWSTSAHQRLHAKFVAVIDRAARESERVAHATSSRIRCTREPWTWLLPPRFCDKAWRARRRIGNH